jgi:signal transduction histidine kinase
MRAKAAGGTVHIDHRGQEGTEVHVVFPLSVPVVKQSEV